MERDGDVVRWRDSRRHGRGEVTARRTTCQEERKVSTRKRKEKKEEESDKKTKGEDEGRAIARQSERRNGDGIKGKGTGVTKGRRSEDEGRYIERGVSATEKERFGRQARAKDGTVVKWNETTR